MLRERLDVSERRGPAGSRVSTAPPSATSHAATIVTTVYASACARSCASIRAGATGAPGRTCAKRAGSSTTRRSSASGARKACACPRSATSAGVSALLHRLSGLGPRASPSPLTQRQERPWHDQIAVDPDAWRTGRRKGVERLQTTRSTCDNEIGFCDNDDEFRTICLS